MPKLTPAERFWAKVEKTPGCWNWTASKNEHGYGRFRTEGRVVKAHRAAYEIARGPIPPRLVVDHICHNPGCVNPDHLRLATHKQNQENRAGARHNNKSGVRGVVWYKASGKWRAQVGHKGKLHHVGMFANLNEAAAAVAAKRRDLFTHSEMDRISA
ncbi:HNH endonuclease signature motif containing protein [Arthrobacter sp. efr-133-TYG-118]|uniref:HNH endonuclease signature motif containing protein n=1 Tax=Arthrobacter sp. efr-133-TYG-118 TaxID=3040279 RepID=UPI0025512E78|nr:HNH endonuclease signature motif containing protein [Arthrobacter sp. efr-133-TYG-118]